MHVGTFVVLPSEYNVCRHPKKKNNLPEAFVGTGDLVDAGEVGSVILVDVVHCCQSAPRNVEFICFDVLILFFH